ncbi:SDR family oxidoreductase [Sphingomonas sp. PAMC 26605]|uniref:SDR family oxidoreductase n=1 Tax=Sphingomonas sp. PAMC 26605 TaxID=1112214 RepID=UPI00026CB1D7|nr:SDR family oxidoreductase [Sphingomonas sp. PAMC 26605]
MLDDRFRNKVVIVTGAAAPICAAAASLFRDEGAQLVLIDRASGPFSALVARLGPDRIASHVANVTTARTAQRLAADTIKRFGTIDVLINGAGGRLVASPSADPLDQWEQLLNGHLAATIAMARAVLAHLIESNGNIVNIASLSGVANAAGDVNLQELLGRLTRSLSSELRPKGVGINAVCVAESLWPGYDPIDVAKAIGAFANGGAAALLQANSSQPARLPLSRRIGDPHQTDSFRATSGQDPPRQVSCPNALGRDGCYASPPPSQQATHREIADVDRPQVSGTSHSSDHLIAVDAEDPDRAQTA